MRERRAELDILNIRLGADVTKSKTGKILRAEAHEIVFGEHQPMRREHPFGTTAYCPARLFVVTSRTCAPAG